MSKKLSLFALVAVLVMAFTGSAFASEYTWKGAAGANWSSPENWQSNIVPKSLDVAIFPNSTTTVNIVGSHDVGAIRIDSGAENVVFNLQNVTSALHIVASQDVNGHATPGIQAQGNARFEGEGIVILAVGSTAAGKIDGESVPGSFLIDVSEGKTLDFGVIVSEDKTGYPANDTSRTVNRIVKANKGTLAFTSNQNNKLNGNVLYLDLRDGEVAISRSGHLDGNINLLFNTKGIQGRTATLTTTWTNEQTFNKENKVWGISNGTINVAGEGSTLTLDEVPQVVFPAGANRTITKAGVGTLKMSDVGVWGVDGENNNTLNIKEGSVVLAKSYAIAGENQVNVSVGADTEFRVDKVVEDDIRNLTGSGTLTLLERGVLTANGPASVFPGKITGAGSIRFGTTRMHTANALITGTENDFTGDIFVGSLAAGAGSSLTIEDAANLGGNNKWSTPKLYLDAISQGQVTPYSIENFARLVITDGKNFTLPNEIFIGDSRVDHANANYGSAVIFVPVDTQLTLSKNVTYNRNTLAKAGEGDIIMENLGYDSIGGANFVSANGNGTGAGAMPTGEKITTALHIVNGRVRIENDMAAAVGDIVLDSGTSTANRAILSLRNGLRMHNSIMFTAQSTFQTELKSANLASGTDVQSAVEVGQVYYNRYFESGELETQSYTGLVYNRVNFDDLDGKTINKGDRFQFMKSTRFSNYGSNQVYPTDYDGLDKAPFDPYFSTVYLYFDALKTIDVPVLGQPSVSSIKPSEAFNFTVPVESVSGLKADSQSVFTTPAIADVRATIEGSNVRVRGTAPETGQVTFLVRVSSTGDAQDVLEYTGERSFTLAVTSDDVPDPEKPVSNVPAPVSDVTAGTIAAAAYKFDVAGEPVINETLTFKLEQLLTSEARGEFVDGVYELTDITGTDGKASVTFEGIGEGTYALSVFDTSGVQIGTTRTITDFQTPIDPVDPSDGGSSSGCDAGFGAFALLALGAAVVLRKKD